MFKKIKAMPRLYLSIGIFIAVIAVAVVIVCVSTNANKNTLLENNSATGIPTRSSATDATAVIATRPTATEIITQSPTATMEQATQKATMHVTQSDEIINNRPTSGFHSDTTQNTTQPPTDEMPYPPAPTEAPTESAEQKLADLISGSGYTPEQISTLGIGQLIVADTLGTQADIYLFTNNDGVWTDDKIKCGGFVGSAGAGDKQSENDSITPLGLYGIGEAFYIDVQPSTWLNMFKITENTYWVDDPNSAMYNKKVEGEVNKDWESAKHMIDEPESYKYGFVINYNTNPITAGKGSAVFMQCGTAATDGSIAVSEENMLLYLDKLNASKNPHILIF